MLAIEGFFRFADPPDQLRGSHFAQPLAKNGVVALPETGSELFVRDWGTFAGHCVAPRLPMVFGRVDEGSIHVPEYGSIHAMRVLHRISVTISDARIVILLDR
jgi:hypothetical protein